MEPQNPKNRYFFELIPINLNRVNRKNRRKINQNSQVKFAIFLQSHKIGQSKEWMLLQFVQNIFKCKNTSIDFYIANFNPEFYSNFTVKVVVKQPPKLRYENDPEHQEICRVEQSIYELGSFLLDPGVYIDTFKEDRKALFQQNIEISPQFSLDYELYIQKTRFNLEKLIRESRGSNKQANILISAFKKRSGKKKVRYVELNESGQRSVKEEDFKKNKKILISSLKKSGNKYIPQKTVEPDSNSSRNMTPLKPQNSYKQQSSSFGQDDNNLLKIASKFPQNDRSRVQTSFLESPRMTRGAMFDRSVINPHWSFDESFINNRSNLEKCYESTLLAIFWGAALFLLYIAMIPSKKT